MASQDCKILGPCVITFFPRCHLLRNDPFLSTSAIKRYLKEADIVPVFFSKQQIHAKRRIRQVSTIRMVIKGTSL